MAAEGSMPVSLDESLSKGKKLPLKRVKKKPELNISKGKLKSISKQQNFSFLNASVQKQTLRANNRALAQSLAKSREEMRQMHKVNKDLLAQNQELVIKNNRLKRVAGIRDNEIEAELQKRMKQVMLSLKKLCEDTSRSMMQSSECLNSIYDVCVEQSRRSTGIGEGRGSSMGVGEEGRVSSLGVGDEGRCLLMGGAAMEEEPALVTDTVRAGPRRNMFQADSAQPLSDLPVKSSSVFHSGMSDISMIMEQSMMDDGIADEPEYVAVALEAVKEVNSDTNIAAPVESFPTHKSKVLSKLPQRVAKDGSALLEKNDKSETANTIKACAKESQKAEKEKEPAPSKSKSRTDKKSKDKSQVAKSTNIKSNEKGSKTNEVVSQSNKHDVGSVPAKVPNVDTDIDLDTDVSLFGFGGNFAVELVSGSPISNTNWEDSKAVPATKINSENSENKDKNADKELNDKARRETFVLPQPAVVQESKAKSSKDKSNDSGKQKPAVTNKSNKVIQKSSKTVASSSSLRNDKEMPHSSKGQKQPENPKPIPQVQEQRYDVVSNPFKPTKTLIRSPPAVYVSPYQKTNEEPSIDSRAFIASLRQSSETAVQRSPIPEPRFSHEPTMIFNSDMEFTEIIDTSNLTSFNKSYKVSPNIPEDANLVDKPTQGLPQKEVSQAKDIDNHEFVKPSYKNAPKVTKQKSSRSKASSKTDEAAKVADTLDAPSVEVRSKKPGVFTFNVGRKEADGTRKAVPEETSRARSKKKKAVTPEKDEERKAGDDRDMFNFGDRTPTMPLDKLVKPVTKNVYDLSMNESVVQTNSLKSLRDNNKKAAPVIPEPKPDEHIYYLPMPKGSPEEKPAPSNSRSRSKSSTRSKSKTRHKSGEDDDDDWEPGKSRSRARSASRSRKTFDMNEPVAPRWGRSQSRVRNSSESVAADKDGVDKESVQVNAKERKTDVQPRRGRSRSRVRKPDFDDECEDIEPEKVVRSKSRSRKSAKEDEIEFDGDELDVTQLERKSRSRSIHRRKTYVLDEVEENKKEKCLKEKLVADSPVVKRSRQTRGKSIIVLDSDDESSVSDNSEKKEIAETFCIGDCDSDHAKETVESKSTQPSGKKSVANKVLVESENESDAKNSDTNEKSMESDEPSIRVIDTFITKSRARRSKRLNSIDPDLVDDHGLDIFENGITEEQKVSKTKDTESRQGKLSRSVRKSRSKMSFAVDSEDDKEEDNKSPTPKKKLKSTKKSVRKKKEKEGTDSSAEVKKSKAKLTMEEMDTEDTKNSLPLKTRAVCEAGVSKESTSKSSRKGKSTSKRPAKDSSGSVEGETPKAKKVKASPEHASESDIALLKKRLTMIVTSKGAPATDKIEGSVKVADLDRTLEERPVLQDVKSEPIQDDNDSDRKHRRNRNPVSYVPKPLNVKLRQGDQLFVEPLNKTKVKAEMSRLAIARKMCVPKVSRDDKENVDLTKAK